MRKKIVFQHSGKSETLGFTSIIRSLPNRFVNTIGHFVFLDQIPYKGHNTEWLKKELSSIKQGSYAHPHRGISTVSYLIKGTIEHFDSAGNHGIVHDGGMQWMKAGNGIIHDEIIHANESNDITEILGLQFWINLPAKNKGDQPEYMNIESENIPAIILPESKGKINVLIGQLEGKTSKIPTDSSLFLYHLELNAGKSHIININENDESAITLIRGDATINNLSASSNDLLVFDNEGDTIEIVNKNKKSIDVMIFGGEPYLDSIAFGGPYVMNTQKEVDLANVDFYAGKYGTVNYNLPKT